ncbi:MAG: prepilin-type N-terminal cleavage/methylation domain-containing protein [Thiovulaceae bacterium]|nr:prepilin-type N-terminal cleavage/methylation domain-containing protein [Sulfurimonadaceae bacterium]
MRKGFTLIELIFVIVIFGILSKFGADILYKIYENYIYSNTFNRLENQSEAAVKQIANRLQYRIKDSTIARDTITSTNIEPIGSNTGNENVLEWIGTDIDGWQGTSSTAPDWSGFIDLAASSSATLNSPGTSITDPDLGIFFIGSNVDLNSSAFGWDGTNIKTSTTLTHADIAIHPVDFTGTSISSAMTTATDFNNSDVYEYYQLSRSAYAVSLDTATKKLWFYYDYQPWLGQSANTNGTPVLIMENVSSFKFTSMGDIMVIQVCVSDNNITGVGEYSICKEKVVF